MFDFSRMAKGLGEIFLNTGGEQYDRTRQMTNQNVDFWKNEYAQGKNDLTSAITENFNTTDKEIPLSLDQIVQQVASSGKTMNALSGVLGVGTDLENDPTLQSIRANFEQMGAKYGTDARTNALNTILGLRSTNLINAQENLTKATGMYSNSMEKGLGSLAGWALGTFAPNNSNNSNNGVWDYNNWNNKIDNMSMGG